MEKRTENKIKDLYLKGEKIKSIQSKTGIKSKSTIYLALHRLGLMNEGDNRLGIAKRRLSITLYKEPAKIVNRRKNKSQYINACILFYEKNKNKLAGCQD